MFCQEHVPSLSDPKNFKVPVDLNNAWVALSIALIAILPSVEWNLVSLTLSCIPVLALFNLFVALMSKIIRPARSEPDIDLRRAAGSLSWRVLTLLVLNLMAQTYIFELPPTALLPTFVLGILKALFWFFAARAVSYHFLDVNTALIVTLG